MLSDSEKQRIHDEEVFRAEVRQLIAPPEKEHQGRTGLWKQANSPIALWFLSSVVLTAITGGASWYLSNRSIERERAQTIRKLTTEADYRIRRTDSYMRILYKSYVESAPKEDDKDDLSVPGTQVDAFYKNLLFVDKEGAFKDLSELTLRSLLWELVWELERFGDVNRKREAEAAFNGAKALKDFIEKFEDESVKDGSVPPNSVRSRTYFVENLEEVHVILADLKRVLI